MLAKPILTETCLFCWSLEREKGKSILAENLRKMSFGGA
jgi:hypothetical protein